jgi:hypothetical protein
MEASVRGTRPPRPQTLWLKFVGEIYIYNIHIITISTIRKNLTRIQRPGGGIGSLRLLQGTVSPMSEVNSPTAPLACVLWVWCGSNHAINHPWLAIVQKPPISMALFYPHYFFYGTSMWLVFCSRISRMFINEIWKLEIYDVYII